MKKISLQGFILIISVVSLLLSCNSKKETGCIIKGETINRNSDTLILLKATGSIRSPNTHIPIIDNHFEYKLDVKDVEAYQFIFYDELYGKGVWRAVTFFPDKDVVEFMLYPKDSADNNIIRGGELNKTYADYLKKLDIFKPELQPIYDYIDSLEKEKKYWSEKANVVFDKITEYGENQDSLNACYRELKRLRESKEDITPAALVANEKIEKIYEKRDIWKYDYIKNNPDIVSYYLLIMDLLNNDRSEVVEGLILRNFPLFEKKFPDHPYTSLAKNLIEGMEKIKEGGMFVDFSAPDLEGNIVKASDIIKNHKVTYLDLWASWCSPCIGKSKAIIPVYNDFKDRGFTVLGVAREMKNTKAMKKAIERYGFPWLNLVDLDDKNNIWKKYDIPFSGGGTFLIDSSGKIIAVDPPAKDVRVYLEKELSD